jgi:hypothetical protein
MGLAKMRAQWRARDRAIHCQTHVGKQTVALGVEQDVLGLEVAVQHATTVHVFNRQDQLGDDETRHVLPEESSKKLSPEFTSESQRAHAPVRFLFEPQTQIAAFRILEHHVEFGRGAEVSVKRYNERVQQFAHKAALLNHHAANALQRQHALLHHLDGIR